MYCTVLYWYSTVSLSLPLSLSLSFTLSLCLFLSLFFSFSVPLSLPLSHSLPLSLSNNYSTSFSSSFFLRHLSQLICALQHLQFSATSSSCDFLINSSLVIEVWWVRFSSLFLTLLSFCLCVSLSVFLSVSVCPCVCLFVVCLCFCPSVYLFVRHQIYAEGFDFHVPQIRRCTIWASLPSRTFALVSSSQ